MYLQLTLERKKRDVTLGWLRTWPTETGTPEFLMTLMLINIIIIFLRKN